MQKECRMRIATPGRLFTLLLSLSFWGSVEASDKPPKLRVLCRDHLPENLEARLRELSHEKTVVVADPHSSGSDFIDPLIKKGYKIVYYRSRSELSQVVLKGHEPHKFSAEIYADDYSDEEIYRLLKILKPRFVFAGCESGVEEAVKIAFELSKVYEIPNFGPYHEGMRSKHIQALMLKAAGLRYVKGIAASTLDEIYEWVDQEKLAGKRIVIKPEDSAAGFKVQFPTTRDEIATAYENIINHPSLFGKGQSRVLAQEYLPGPELAVNAVIRHGKVVITSIWLYEKDPENPAVYLYNYFMPFRGKLQDAAVKYFLKVVPALKIKDGWAHAEIKVEAADGPAFEEILKAAGVSDLLGRVAKMEELDIELDPVMIENGQRIMGGHTGKFEREFLGESQIEVGIEALEDPELFAKRPLGYKDIQGWPIVVTLNSKQGGKFRGQAMEHFILKIPELNGVYKQVGWNYDDDEVVPPTEDLYTALGRARLVLKSQEDREKVKAIISTWAAEGLFAY